MSKVLVNDTTLTNIANAIREKTGETIQYKPSAMASAIATITTGPDWDWGGYSCVTGTWTPTEKSVEFDYTVYMNNPQLVFMACPELFAAGMGSSDPNEFGVQFLFGDNRSGIVQGDAIDKSGTFNQYTVHAAFKYTGIQLTLPSIEDPSNFFPAGKTYNFILIGFGEVA